MSGFACWRQSKDGAEEVKTLGPSPSDILDGNMDATDKLLDSAKTLSKAAETAILAIICVSFYLAQRFLQVFYVVTRKLAWMSLDQTREFYNDLFHSQGGIFGLSYSYGTMTVFWPIVLGFLCILFRELVRRRQTVVKRLADTLDPSDRALIGQLDPFSLSMESAAVPVSEPIWKIVKHLPRIALALHLVSEILLACNNLYPGPLSMFVLFFIHLGMMLTVFYVGWRWVATFPETVCLARTPDI
jgi:hypothetical protein